MEPSLFVLQKQKDLQELSAALKCPEDPEKAERIFRAILHTLRDGLNLDDAINLLRVLPHSLKTIYIENWHPSASGINWLNPHLFIKEVRDRSGKIAYYDFPSESLTERYIRAVFKFIEKEMNKSKRQIFRAILPFSLLAFFEPVSQVAPFMGIYKAFPVQRSQPVTKIV